MAVQPRYEFALAQSIISEYVKIRLVHSIVEFFQDEFLESVDNNPNSSQCIFECLNLFQKLYPIHNVGRIGNSLAEIHGQYFEGGKTALAASIYAFTVYESADPDRAETLHRIQECLLTVYNLDVEQVHVPDPHLVDVYLFFLHSYNKKSEYIKTRLVLSIVEYFQEEYLQSVETRTATSQSIFECIELLQAAYPVHHVGRIEHSLPEIHKQYFVGGKESLLTSICMFLVYECAEGGKAERLQGVRQCLVSAYDLHADVLNVSDPHLIDIFLFHLRSHKQMNDKVKVRLGNCIVEFFEDEYVNSLEDGSASSQSIFECLKLFQELYWLGDVERKDRPLADIHSLYSGGGKVDLLEAIYMFIAYERSDPERSGILRRVQESMVAAYNLDVNAVNVPDPRLIDLFLLYLSSPNQEAEQLSEASGLVRT